jgi:hypothetical protein
MISGEILYYAASSHTIGHTQDACRGTELSLGGGAAQLAPVGCLKFAGTVRTLSNSRYINRLQRSRDVPRLAWAGIVPG